MKLSVENLCLKYTNTVVFNNLSFEINEGEILGLRGANGCGKSSLALCLAGLLKNDDDSVFIKGRITYGGKNLFEMSVAERCRAVGMIFQNPDNQLFSPLVVEELAFAPENLALPREEIRKRVDEALRTCDIAHLKNSKTNSLSGGEKQLVAIAAVLTMKPSLLIADEITSRIDSDRIESIRKILKDYASNGGSVILISHNISDMALADKVIDMEKGKDYGNKI